MRPLSLRLNGFVVYPELELDFPEGAVAVLGPNGAGKSTLVDSIWVALFGPQTGTLAGYVADDGSTDRCEVELTFAHDGETYRVRRGYSIRNKAGKPTLDLEWLDAMNDDARDVWVPQTHESVKETQAAIEELLGFAAEHFRASSFLAQGGAGSFLSDDLDRKQRLQVLSETVLGLRNPWPKRAAMVRAQRQQTEQAAASVAGQVALLETQAARVQELDDARDDAAEVVAGATVKHRLAVETHEHARRMLQEAATRAAERRAAEAEHANCIQELDARRQIIDRAYGASAAAVELREQIAALEPAAGYLATAEQTLEAAQEGRRAWQNEQDRRARIVADADRRTRALDGRRRERDQLIAKSESLDQQAIDLDATPHSLCPTCEQALDTAARGRAESALRRDAKQAREQAAEINQEIVTEERAIATLREDADPGGVVWEEPSLEALAGLQNGVAKARDAAFALAHARERLAQAEQVQAEATVEVHADAARLTQAVKAAEAKVAAFADDEPVPVAMLQQRENEERHIVLGAATFLDQAKDAFSRADVALEQAQAAARDLETARAELATTQQRLATLQTLEKAFGPDGVPVLLVESVAIPQIEAEANRVLRLLGGKTAAATVELRTQRALKTGDGARDALDIVVITNYGTERPYERWSGGEKSRIALAVAAGLAKVLPRSDVFVIDEPDGLDRQGKQALVQLIQESEAALRILISHDAELADAFDTTIDVTELTSRQAVAA